MRIPIMTIRHYLHGAAVKIRTQQEEREAYTKYRKANHRQHGFTITG